MEMYKIAKNMQFILIPLNCEHARVITFNELFRVCSGTCAQDITVSVFLKM